MFFLELLYNLQYIFIYTSWENTEEDPTPQTRHTHCSLHTWHCTRHMTNTPSVRWHCHGRVKSACDDAGDGTAMRRAHAGQHAKGSREERGRSLLLLLLPVFPRRFHVVPAAFFLRSFPLTMKIQLSKDGAACQTHDECSQIREERAVQVSCDSRAGMLRGAR